MDPQTENDQKRKVIEAFQSTPTTYHIDVLDKTMLPEKLKNKDKLSFTVKPPTLNILAKAGEQMLRIPYQEWTNPAEATKYTDEMVKTLCVLAHGKESAYPEWYEPFLKNNLTAKELFIIFQEILLKSQAGFFLSCLKTHEALNPMMMMRLTEAKTTK